MEESDNAIFKQLIVSAVVEHISWIEKKHILMNWEIGIGIREPNGKRSSRWMDTLLKKK